MAIREILYKTPFRRTIMRFIEIFVLAGIAGIICSVEFETLILTSFGTAIGALLLKFLRELLSSKNPIDVE